MDESAGIGDAQPENPAGATVSSGWSGGLARSILRTTFRRLASVRIGSFPRVRPSTIAKSAEKLDFILGVHQHLQTAHRETQVSQSSDGSKKERTQAGRLSTSLKETIIRSIPSFAKGSVLGSALFYTYDNFFDVTRQKIESLSPFPSSLWSSSSERSVTAAAAAALVVGAGGGVVHGCMSLLWDRAAAAAAASRIPLRTSVSVSALAPATPLFPVTGMLVSHALVHSLLFGSYETSKTLGLAAARGRKPTFGRGRTDDDYAQVAMEAVAVFVAGCVAGVVADVAQHYLKPIETLALTRRSDNQPSTPPSSSPTPSSVSSAPAGSTSQGRPSPQPQSQSQSLSAVIRGNLRVALMDLRAGLRTAPLMRPILTAAIPSGIGFLAYHYGNTTE